MSSVLVARRAGKAPRLSISCPCSMKVSASTRRFGALVPLRERGVEIIIVDGGSTDATVEKASGHGDLVLVAPRGRASQMNAGARAGAGPGILLFLHCDTRLPQGADRLIFGALEQAAGNGAVSMSRLPAAPSSCASWLS